MQRRVGIVAAPAAAQPADGAVTAAAAPADASARGRAFAVAPYVDMSIYPPPQLTTIARQSGLRYFSLAFVLSGGGCKASWGGVTPVDQESAVVADLKSLRARSGDALVSFGGANGVELAQACTSAQSLAAQYQAVITRYRLTRIDFDIEGGAVGDTEPIIIVRGCEVPQMEAAFVFVQPDTVARDWRQGWLPIGGRWSDERDLIDETGLVLPGVRGHLLAVVDDWLQVERDGSFGLHVTIGP